jgi:hypothetical protein
VPTSHDNLHEGRVGELGQPARDLSLTAAGRPDHQDVLGCHLGAAARSPARLGHRPRLAAAGDPLVERSVAKGGAGRPADLLLQSLRQRMAAVAIAQRDLGFGRIVASGREAPNMLANLV